MHQRKLVDFESGEEICQQCGIITGIDENMAFEMAVMSHLALPYGVIPKRLSWITNYNSSSSSIISEKNNDFNGNSIKELELFKRIRYYDKIITVNKNEKTLSTAAQVIVKTAEKIFLPLHVKERAIDIYKKAYKRGGIKGRSIYCCALASLYRAMKENKINKSINDLVDVSIDPKDPTMGSDIFSCYRTIIESLNMPNTEISGPMTDISVIGTRIEITHKTVKKAQDLYNMFRIIDPLMFSGKCSNVIATSLLYLASRINNELITQESIANSGNISTVTLRKRCGDYNKIISQTDVIKKQVEVDDYVRFNLIPKREMLDPNISGETLIAISISETELVAVQQQTRIQEDSDTEETV